MKTFINYIGYAGNMTRDNVLKGLVKVQKNGRYGVKATIPKDVAEELNITPGTFLLVSVDEAGRIVMSKEGVLA